MQQESTNHPHPTQSERHRGDLEVEVDHLKTGGGKQTLTSASKVRLSEMRLKREVTQMKQQILFLEKVVADHEDTIRELENENTGVYDLLTEQRNLDTSVTVVEQTGGSTVREGQETVTTTQHTTVREESSARVSGGYHLCGRCRNKLGAREDAKSAKIVSLEVDYLNKQLEKKTEKITSQKEELDLVKSSLNTAHTRISKLNKDIDKLEEKLAMQNGANPEEYASYKKSQASAQQAISVLNERIDQKDGALKKYQDMLQELRAEAHTVQAKHEKELEKQSKEHSLKEKDWLAKFQELSAELTSLQEIGTAPTPHKRAELEELILEQDKANALLRDSIFKLRQEISDLKTERVANQKSYEKDTEKLKSEHERKAKKLTGEISELNKKNADLLAESSGLGAELKTLKRAKSPRPKTESAKLAEKEEEIAKLKDALASVRREMTTLIEGKMRENVVVMEAGAKEDRTDSDSLKFRVAKLQKERDEAIRERNIAESQLAAKSNPRQAAEIDTLQKQLTVQREKVAKLKSTMTLPAKQPPGNRADNQRIAELERQVEALKQEAASRPPGTVIDAWLDNKKWGKKIENQKKQIEKKDNEIETLTKQNSSMRDTIERMDREKVLLNTKLKNALKLNSKSEKPTPIGYTDTQIYTQELKKRIFELESDNAQLQDDLKRDITNPIAERDSTIAVLRNTISGLEKQLQESCQNGDLVKDFDRLREENGNQAKRLIECEHELLSVKLRAERAELELPRLTSRVNDLQAYADVLKPNSIQGKSVPAPPPPSGKSVMELERVINAMKRVIEKLQRDNAQLKEQLEMKEKEHADSTAPEKNPLAEKLKLAEDKLKMSEQKLKVTEKKVSSIQSELDSRAEENAGLKDKIGQNEAAITELQLKLDSCQREADIERAESMTGLERQLTEKAELITELQDKLSRGEEDMKRKNGLLSEIRRRLTGVAERENDLEEEIRLLHECKMPNGAKEIAREAVRLKRDNAKLSEQLRLMTEDGAPGLDPSVLGKLEELRGDQDVLVKKIVFYQKQLSQLAANHPHEDIVLEFPE